MGEMTELWEKDGTVGKGRNCGKNNGTVEKMTERWENDGTMWGNDGPM